MKKIVAVVVLLVLLAGLGAGPAQAGSATNVALGLASFAVFNQLAFGLFAPGVWASSYYYGYPYRYPYGYYPVVAYAPPAAYASAPAYYAQQPVTYAPPAPPVQNQVVYPTGKYILRGDGVTTAYQWVWVPNPPPPPSGPPPLAAPPPTR